ncbi:MAG: sigma-70 family RNA polymerase sigma factor [Planctomycetota bacterium]|nr:sigma-70 family RNA polymerase sigma factor [Planctomycetota bacterium]
MSETSLQLVERFQAGEDAGADALFCRYLDRLTRLARSRLSARLAGRVDPEDVVMSAYRSFFLGARNGRFLIQRSGDLWALLSQITLHKLYRTVARHSAGRRSVYTEQAGDFELDGGPAAKEPTPEEAAELADFVESLMTGLAPKQQRILELRLQGETIADIAQAVTTSERTVRRILAEIREQLGSRLDAP